MVVGGDGGGVHYQCGGRVAAVGGNGSGIVGENNLGTLGDEAVGEFGRSTVVAGYFTSFGKEVALESGHTYAAGSDEVDVLFHLCKQK